jgi:hypothetical protein
MENLKMQPKISTLGKRFTLNLPSDLAQFLNNQYLLATDRVGYVVPEFDFTLKNGKSISGYVVGVENNKITLHVSEATKTQYYISFNLIEISSFGFSWPKESQRFFISRLDRAEFDSVGNLQINKLLKEFCIQFQEIIKCEFNLANDWAGSTQEDYLILEDNLILLVQFLKSIQKEFPDIVARIKTIGIKKPAGTLGLSIEHDILTMQLPFESNSFFENKNIIQTLLNQILS